MRCDFCKAECVDGERVVNDGHTFCKTCWTATMRMVVWCTDPGRKIADTLPEVYARLSEGRLPWCMVISA